MTSEPSCLVAMTRAHESCNRRRDNAYLRAESEDDSPKGSRAPIGVTSNLVVRTNTPPSNQAGNARTNMWGYSRDEELLRLAENRSV